MIAGFAPEQLAIALFAALGAALVRGLAGFGTAILLVPVLALSMPPVEAVMVSNTVALMIGLTELGRLRRDAEQSAYTIALLVVLTTGPGLYLLSLTPPALARMLITVVALAAFVAVLVPWRGGGRPGAGITILTGMTSGLLTGFAGMPGPPVVPYYVAHAVPRAQAKASMVLIFTAAALAGIVGGVVMGAYRFPLLCLALILLPAVLAGNWLGQRASGRVGDRAWRLFTAAVLGATALVSLVKLLQA